MRCRYSVKEERLTVTDEKSIKLKMTTPKHYDAEVDTIDYIHMHRGLTGTEEFCIGNILKYATRYGKKDEKIKEVEKIIVYANRLKEKLENE